VMMIEKILRSVQHVPAFPITIQKVTALLQDENFSVPEVTSIIRYDQAITANILRMCNSAYFGVRFRIGTLEEAVMFLGKENIITAVQISGVSRFFKKAAKGYVLQANDLWIHSVSVALMSQILFTRIYQKEQPVLYTAALLHDVGKVILGEYVHESFAQIMGMVYREGCSFVEAEERLFGINHAAIGGKIAERWNFPEEITTAIAFHHRPDLTGDNEAIFPWLVYLADQICSMTGVGGGQDGLAYRAVNEAAKKFQLRDKDIEACMVQLFGAMEKAKELMAIV
ncbi:MAG: HDOD domain-containing protein, partial [Pseudomonadota bacterium]